MAFTVPLTPESVSKERSTSPGAADELLLSAPMRSRRLRARKCVADDFDSFIHMTFPISHADWAGESPQKSSAIHGKLSRKNLRLPVAGRVTEMKPLFVERGAATADQPFERERLALSCN